MIKKADKIHIGTSGWHYSHWKGSFYPREFKPKDLLKYYAQHLNTVEINNSFYHLPEAKTLQMWRNIVPSDFLFAVKASRYITHMKKLKDPEDSLGKFLERVDVLGNKLGPVLFQLPPRWHLNLQRFESFLNFLPDRFRYAFEFRDPSWFHEDLYNIMRQYNVAFCMYHLAGFMSPKAVTADIIYVRLHGPGEAYQGQYETEELAGWAGAFSTWINQGKTIYCYFDNDEAGYAVQDAVRLRQMME